MIFLFWGKFDLIFGAHLAKECLNGSISPLCEDFE